MLRLLLLLSLVILIGQSITSFTECDDKFGCVLFQDGDQSLQLWALPNRQGIDVQSLADKHLPVTYVHEMGLVIQPASSESLATERLSSQLETRTDFPSPFSPLMANHLELR